MAIGSNLPGDIDQTKRRQNAAPAVSTPLGMTLTPDQMQEQRRAADMKRAAGRIQQTKENVGGFLGMVGDAVGDQLGMAGRAVTAPARAAYGFAKGIATGEIPVNVYDRPFDYGDGQRIAKEFVEKNPETSRQARLGMQGIADRAVGSAVDQVRAAPRQAIQANAGVPATLAAPKPGQPLAASQESSPSSSPAAGPSDSSQPTAPATPGTPGTTQHAAGQQPGNGWGRTGIGTGMQGGEIVGRVGSNGVAEFSNAPSEQQAAQGRFSAPQLGFGPTSRPASGSAPVGARVLASGTNDPNALPRGSMANLGDGIGTFSQGQAGDSRLALDRFERANAERAKMVQASRGGIGDTGNFTVVADSTRGTPEEQDMAARRRLKYGTDVAMERNRLEGQQLRQNGINSYLDRQLREREVATKERRAGIEDQVAQQGIQKGEMDLAQQQRLTDLYTRYQQAAPEERAALAEQIRTMTGKEAPNRFTVVPGGQEYDAKAGTLVNRPSRVLNNQTGQFVDRGQGSQPSIASDPRAIAIKNNSNLSREEKAAQLKALGYN